MNLSLVAPLLADQLYLLDGGFSDQLALYLGQPRVDGDPLWTARSLVTAPDTVVRVHRDFLAQGARVILTNSYQASLQGFEDHLKMNAKQTREAMTASARLAWRAVEEEGRVAGHALVAGSVGPYGACRGDGSEYTGNYLAAMEREELAEWHRPRVEALVEGRVSCLAVETMPHSKEVMAVLDCVQAASVILPVWVSFTLRDGGHLGGGETVEEAVRAVLRHPVARAGRLMALGVNCSAPEHVTPALRSMRAVTKVTPLVVYPNSGETWDGAAREWRGEGGKWLPLVGTLVLTLLWCCVLQYKAVWCSMVHCDAGEGVGGPGRGAGGRLLQGGRRLPARHPGAHGHGSLQSLGATTAHLLIWSE